MLRSDLQIGANAGRLVQHGSEQDRDGDVEDDTSMRSSHANLLPTTMSHTRLHP